MIFVFSKIIIFFENEISLGFENENILEKSEHALESPENYGTRVRYHSATIFWLEV